jgi:hypothetical protein
MEAERADSHENLILLCAEHHKQVDDQTGHYTVEKLRLLKKSHSDWITSLDNSGPVRWVRDPAFPEPRRLEIILNANSLWNLICDSGAFSYSYAGGIPSDDEDLIIEFLDLIKDWGEIHQDLFSVREQRDAQKGIQEYIGKLAEREYLVGAFLKHRLIAGGGAEPMRCNILHVEVQPAGVAQVGSLRDE